MAVRGSRGFGQRRLFGLLLLLIVVVVSTMAITFYNKAQLEKAQMQPSTAATAFTLALVRNDKQLLMALAAPQQREKVAEWLSSHQRFSCPFGFGLAHLGFPPDLRRLDDIHLTSQDYYLHQNLKRDTIVNFDYVLYTCCINISADMGLNFELEDLVLEWKDGKWYVTSWRFRCESERLNGCG